MNEILEGQELKRDIVLSFRGQILQAELNNILLMMRQYIIDQKAKIISNPITATFRVSQELQGNVLDMEMLIPIDRKIEENEKYKLKCDFSLVNALMIKHYGDAQNIQSTYNLLNTYIVENGYMPLSVAYNVTTHINPIDISDTEISIYVSINPNRL